MKYAVICFGVAILFLTQETLTLIEVIEPGEHLVKMMSEVKNISQWCELMNMEDCEQVIEEAIPDDSVDENGEKVVVSGYEKPEVALFDACNPREQTIALPKHPDTTITVWPPCTRASRCGGCCTSDVFSCEPTAVSEKYVKVFDTRLPYPGANRFTFLGVRLVKIIEHVHCDAQCKTKEHECLKYQKYDSRRCRCTCRPERLHLKNTCSEDQIWDENECDCICPNRNTLKCPDPSYFSSATCKCTLKMGVTGEIDLDKLFEQLDKGLIGPDIILNIQKSKEEDDTNFNITGGEQESQVDTPGESETQKGGESSKDNGKGKEGDSDEYSEDHGKDAKTASSQSSSSTTASQTTSTTTTTATTTTTKTTEPTTPTTTKDPCADTECFGNWKPRRLASGKCQCFPHIG